MKSLNPKTVAWFLVSVAFLAVSLGAWLPSFAWTLSSVPPLLSAFAVGFVAGCYFTLRSA